MDSIFSHLLKRGRNLPHRLSVVFCGFLLFPARKKNYVGKGEKREEGGGRK